MEVWKIDYGIPKNKYWHTGIYCIKVEGIIVYVGQSVNMYNRINNHIYLTITNNKELKYQVLHCFWKAKRVIEFDVLEYVNDKEQLDHCERKWIDELKPLLNTKLK